MMGSSKPPITGSSSNMAAFNSSTFKPSIGSIDQMSSHTGMPSVAGSMLRSNSKSNIGLGGASTAIGATQRSGINMQSPVRTSPA
jgi:hypothetical protein